MIQRLGNAPYLLLVVAALFWGGNAVAGKFLAGSLPPVTISFTPFGNWCPDHVFGDYQVVQT
ncbi:hypothetical protein LC048_10670 [Mesobacillus subterraneus]|uniref:hypothetical protein n=1 Tax=Mesobacillus subterraneus TaxID=285983 RepID=UPI001CFD067B|nr:hypothetical protein [Mesobacillus subterraneus]WLR57276.1 hypothetical protein LC048_10670 [Mesobacillus subterraneus]